MNTIFKHCDKTLVDYWKSYNINESDFYCRKCNKLIINIDEAKDVFITKNKRNENVFKRYSTNRVYAESSQNMWCIKGRTLSGKTYFRHLCWDCLKIEIPNAIAQNDVLQLISPPLFNYWRRQLANGRLQKYLDKLPPPPWNSPIWWFRLIFDMTDEELNQERSKFDTASLSSFIRRYGEDEGKKKYDDYVKLQAKAGCSLEYFVEKLGKEVGTKRYKELCKSKGISQENCIQKYGKEKGQRFFDHYCAVQAYAGSSLLWFIDKYGEEEGKRKYKEICEKKEASKSYSFVSQEMFEAIDKKLGVVALPSRWEKKNHEYEIIAPYDVDFIKAHSDAISNVDSSVGINLIDVFKDDDVKMVKLRPDYVLGKRIIEFNGDFWHANPKIYKPNDVLNWFNKAYDIAEDVWKRDANRLSIFEALGFKVHVVWESDYAENPDKVVEECVKFLKGG